MVDILRPLTQKDILPSVTPKKFSYPRQIVLHLPSLASSWEEEKREHDEEWAERLKCLVGKPDCISNDILYQVEPVIIKPLSMTEKPAGVSSPASEDWCEFAEEEPEIRAKIIAGWQNLETALA